jgi:hypothetical protein
VPVKIHRSISPPSATNATPLRLLVDRDFQIEIDQGFDPQLLRRLITTLRSLP